MISTICQIAILVLGAATIFLLAQKNKLMRWGYIVGLTQEVFWFYETYTKQQWGIFLLCFVYTGCFILGVYNYFIRR
jgi:hypothetical protein